jgi:hypothetical protein
MALPLAIASYAGWTTASAQTPEIVVASEVGSLASGQISSSDTASLLSSVAAACPMHMNPPLSYIDPSTGQILVCTPLDNRDVDARQRQLPCQH